MLFNTIEYLFFLPLVVIAYFLIPFRFRWMLLLAASFYFYMCWKVEYIILIIISTLIDYFCAQAIEKRQRQRSKTWLLVVSLVTNLGLLFAFKYSHFIFTNLNLLFSHYNLFRPLPLMNVLLPVGISFYTFQTLSYTIDVYYGRQKAEKHLGYFALYVSYFPQLVAGPIERFSRLAPQLRQYHPFSYDNLINGLRLILYGLFIKMVIADNLSAVVDKVYASPALFAPQQIITALVFYSFQIYSDFYGYSTIAVGSAMIMGVNLMDNFKTPYLARNIMEFWQRWHISLSTWFRDYLYYPLGGNRVGKGRWFLNIMVVFIVSGIWHGANWTFLVWGALFGILYLAERGFNALLNLKQQYKPWSPGHILLALKTFVLVTLIWVFFRSQSLEDARVMFSLMIGNHPAEYLPLAIPVTVWVLLILFILSDIVLYNKRFDTWVGSIPWWIRWIIYGVLLFSVIVFSGVEHFQFIYFQF